MNSCKWLFILMEGSHPIDKLLHPINNSKGINGYPFYPLSPCWTPVKWFIKGILWTWIWRQQWTTWGLTPTQNLLKMVVLIVSKRADLCTESCRLCCIWRKMGWISGRGGAIFLLYFGSEDHASHFKFRSSSTWVYLGASVASPHHGTLPFFVVWTYSWNTDCVALPSS